MFHLTKKILIGISLIISYLLTLGLSLFITPPYPRLSIIADSLSRLGRSSLHIQLPSLFALPQIASVIIPTDQPSSTSSNDFIFSKNSSVSNQPTPTNTSLENKLMSLTQPPTVNPTASSQLPTVGQPTKTPKPTKPPKPTPKPTIKLAALRPGKNFQDAANIIEPIICIPQAMIMATLDNEYGPWMAGVEADWTNRNTYQGSDPHDNPGSAKVVGVMQMMEDTWSRIKPIVSQKFGGAEMSIAVTFDAMAAGGYHLRNISLAMHDKIACDDWPVKYILFGACRYNGACVPGSTTYNQYAYDVCNAYNRYTKGPKKNCK